MQTSLLCQFSPFRINRIQASLAALSLLLAGALPAGAQQQISAGDSVDLGISGELGGIELEHTLTAGESIAAWKTLWMVAHDEGTLPPEPPTLARLRVSYVDGHVVNVNLRYGESIGLAVREWWNPADGFITHLPFARIAAAEATAEGALTYNVLYRLKWENPRTGVAIKSIHYAASAGLGSGTIQIGAATPLQANADSGALYVVSPYGDDAAAGSFDAPWATLAHAASRIQPGDTVFVRGGTYRPTERITFRDLAAGDARTRIIGYPGETAIFDFLNAHWDESEDREQLGFEAMPHDQSMIMLYRCEGVSIANLQVHNSRARGLGMEEGKDNAFLHNLVYRTFGPGIRFASQTGSRLTGNTIIRPTSIQMGPAEFENAGHGPVVFQTGQERFVVARNPVYMPQINRRAGELSHKPPMEGIDAGKLVDCIISYNRIAWGDKELCLIDGDVDGLRIHHNYTHDAHNRPWASAIAPNGYGEQQNIEMDHNIAYRVGTAFGIGTEGGGFGRHVRIHHNVVVESAWNPHNITGAWGDSDAYLQDIRLYNNTAWNNGVLVGNEGPAGGIALFFPSSEGKLGREIKGAVEDVTVANNLILQPRDYALALAREGDPLASRIHFTHNLTDIQAPSDILKTERNRHWRPFDGDHLIIVDQPVLRNPAERDFRPLPDSQAIDRGIAIAPDGTPIQGESSYIGAFGPNSRWVELD